MFRSLVNYFIPKAISNNKDELHKARILIIVLLITSLSNLVGSYSAIGIHFTYACYVLIVSSILCLALVFFYKNGLSSNTTVHINLIFGFVQIFLQAWWGGGLEAPSTVALFLIPAIAMLLLGRKVATYWLIITVSAVLFMFWYEGQYGQLPELYDTSMSRNFAVNGIVGMMVTFFVIILAIDKEKNNAYRDLHVKNELLKSTQTQLIHSGKLASLGELTAGIAHEIQNPLNFVNNFSELSIDLVKELSEEITKPQIDKSLVTELFDDLKHNQEKINLHGKRASSIVKSMLEHSRERTGIKELTDINVIVNEYFRLSYHGLRAKDKNFNTAMESHFDQSLPKVNIIPQDFGRVVLNLINNAFYAVNERRLKESKMDPINHQKLYEPCVSVTTDRVGNNILIHVKDNGAGIPENIKDKIFNPFFTTKPPGQGTGLGLSLSHEIIEKGHGGVLNVDSTEGVGTEFIIQIPISK